MSFTRNPDFSKGKKNRLKVGQKVVARPKLVDWNASHLSWCAGKPVRGDSSYNDGQLEIGPEELSFVYIWTNAKLSGKMPVGVVTHYGADDDTKNSKGEKIVGRKNVFVEFKVRTSFGNLKYGCYVPETDLVLLK